MAYLDSDFQNKIKLLPEDLQKAIWDLDVYQKMLDIRDKHQLLINEGGDIYDEVKKVLVGEERAEDFSENIRKKLDDVDPKVLAQVIIDVDEEIFRPIKESLMRIEGLKESTLSKEETEEINPSLNKADILSGIEKPTPSSQLSRTATGENNTASLENPDSDIDNDLENIDLETNIEDEPLPEEMGGGSSTLPKKERLEDQIILPKTSGGSLYNITERLRNKDLNVVTDAKKLEDRRREEMERNMAAGGTARTAPSGESAPDKLREVVRAPKQNIEVKPAEQTPAKPAAPDPYREAI